MGRGRDKATGRAVIRNPRRRRREPCDNSLRVDRVAGDPSVVSKSAFVLVNAVMLPSASRASHDLLVQSITCGAAARSGAAAASHCSHTSALVEEGVVHDPGSPRPLLLVLAHGVGERELATVRDAAGWRTDLGHASLALPGNPVRDCLHELDATADLRNLGIDVDRSSLLLRPAGRTDETAMQALAGRALGPAPVTLFEATSVLAQAIAGGTHAALVAAAELGTMLTRLGTRVRRGDLPEVWLIGLGSAAAVHTTFDLDAAWQQHVLAPLADDLALRLLPGLATILGDNQRALDLAAHTLGNAPFARHGHLLPRRPGRLRFAAGAGIAFGKRRTCARPARR